MFNTQKIQLFFKNHLGFLDLDGKRKYEFSKDLVGFSANRLVTTPKKYYIKYIILFIILFVVIFYGLLFLLKPVREVEFLKFSRDNIINLDEKASKEDIQFQTNTDRKSTRLNSSHVD